jgi:hypothetical protein
MRAKNLLVVLLTGFLIGCTDFGGIENVEHALNCQPNKDIDKRRIVLQLAATNGCDVPREIVLSAISENGEEIYEIKCSGGAMEFRCNFYSDEICFFGKNDIPFNSAPSLAADPSDQYSYEAACWRTK